MTRGKEMSGIEGVLKRCLLKETSEEMPCLQGVQKVVGWGPEQAACRHTYEALCALAGRLRRMLLVPVWTYGRHIRQTYKAYT